MPTNAEILSLAPGAGYLAANAKSKSVLFPNFGRLNPILPQQIYALYFVIKKIYDLNPNYSGMTAACLYLWEIMGRYGLAAQGIAGGGGSVPSPTPPARITFPLYIFGGTTGSSFESDGITYLNPYLFGLQIAIFPDQYSQQFLLAGDDTFTVNTSGLVMNIPGFDANTQTWVIRVEQWFGNIPTPPTSNILSEIGNNLITETGNNIITE